MRGGVHACPKPFSLLGWGIACALLAAGCSSDKPAGPIQISLIQPVSGQRCQYRVAPATVHTLDSLNEMRGRVGRVVRTSENLESREEILDLGEGLDPVDVQFSESGGVYYPLDNDSLFAASLYYAIETGYRLFSQLDPVSDMSVSTAALADTYIVHDAIRTFGEVGVDPNVYDNAEFLPHSVDLQGGSRILRNFFFSFPTKEITSIPLGLNLGIMVHEFTHLVMHHLFYEPAFQMNVQVDDGNRAFDTLRALDEGIADYFGFVATGDPSFFLCSYPTESRDLSISKGFTSGLMSTFGAATFDPHDAGAVWASIQYKIGNAIGHETNGRALIRLMANMKRCAVQSNTLAMTFSSIAQCHMAEAAPAARAAMSQIYSQSLGSVQGVVP